MMLQIKNNIKADFLILYRSDFIKGTLWVCLLLISFIVYSASCIISEDASSWYFVNQMYITLVQLTAFVIIIIGSFLGTVDNDNQTFCVRLVNSNRLVVGFARIMVIAITAVALFVSHLAIGIFFDLFSNTVEWPSLNDITKSFSVFIVVFMWGCISYLLGFITGSLTISSSVCIGYFLMESFVDRFLPAGILKILPVWNQKSFLKEFFPENEGAIAIVLNNVGDYKETAVVVFLYIAISLIAVYALERKKQYK